MLGLKKTLQSIQNQSYKNFETWILDADSTDNTKDFLQTLQPPFFYKSQNDLGIYDAMNQGITKSKGEWLLFLGSGDVLQNEQTLHIISGFFDIKEYQLIAGKAVYQAKGAFIYNQHKQLKNPKFNFLMWLYNGLHHQATIYNRQLFENQSYNFKYKILADYEFNLNLFVKDKKCLILKDVISVCAVNGISKAGNWQLYQEEIDLKIQHSSIVFAPFFYSIVLLKFLLKKLYS